jgi:ribosomal protein S18 acetylase RimI-like enzyme
MLSDDRGLKSVQVLERTMIAIRKARAADLPDLVTLEREFDREERKIVLKENEKLRPYLRALRSTRSLSEQMRKWIASRNSLVLIAEADSRQCGYLVAWTGRNKGIFRPKMYGFIAIMFVRPEHRGEGIGSSMMGETLAWFKKRNVTHVGLTVLSDNKHARRIYERWGFGDFSSVMWKWN